MRPADTAMAGGDDSFSDPFGDEARLDEEISRLAQEAYRKFASEALVKLLGGVDRASYCAGFDEGYRAALEKRAAE